jgi:hypothetical protein
MNLVGLVGILVSETWLTCLECRGDITRSTFVHGPTLGAALYTTFHFLALYLLVRGARGKEAERASRAAGLGAVPDGRGERAGATS